MKDQYFMREALSLAKENMGFTYPNPSVACIIVKNDQIISKGVTAKNGRPHAESLAFEQLSAQDAKDSTIYITLEPCFHHGITPPCVDILIKAQIRKIFIAMLDPDNRVNGQSIEKMRQSGIEVEVGLEESEARDLYAGFIKLKTTNMPFVTLKLATSLDGKIALSTGDSRWITGEKAREFAHEIRSKNDAIMVGINTILKDDPLLNCRIKGLESASPIKVILDKELITPLNAKVFSNIDEVPLWIITQQSNHLRFEKLQNLGAKIITINWNEHYIHNALQALGAHDIAYLMTEGGAATATSLIKENLVDKLIWITANKIIGNDGKSSIGDLGCLLVSQSREFKLEQAFALDNDVVKIYSSP